MPLQPDFMSNPIGYNLCEMGHLHLILLPTAAMKVSPGEELPKLSSCAELGQNV